MPIGSHGLKKVRVYDDDGVSKTCLPHVLRMFKNYDVSTIGAQEIIGGRWIADSAVLCFPGGASVPYAKKLNGEGNRQIKLFLEGGGAYFGICAGAYYGAARIEFDRGGPLEVICENELKLFEVAALGPAFGKFDYKTYRHVAVSSNVIGFDGGSRLANLMFYGGPYFANCEGCEGVSVLARYAENGQPSIIYGKYGPGTVVLSGVHLSIDETFFNEKTDRYLRKLAPQLSQTANVRRKLIASIFDTMGLEG